MIANRCLPFCPAVVAFAFLTFCITSASAGGIERTGQDISILFEQKNFVEVGFGSVDPEIGGTDVALVKTGSVYPRYSLVNAGFKQDFNRTFSYSFILDQPFGTNVNYPAATSGGSLMLGGTSARVSSAALTGVGRYKLSESLALHGGGRLQRLSGGVKLDGLAYGALRGYEADFDSANAVGYVLGASFEIPDIALRLALTYNSAIKHKLKTIESLSPSTSVTDITTPQSVNLDFQTGVAATTIAFAQIRWVDWSAFKLKPIGFGAATGGSSLTDISDTTAYTVGLARKFSDTWSGVASFSIEGREGAASVSPLGPYNGKSTVVLAAVLTLDKVKLTPWASYSKLGDASPVTSGTPRASFTGSQAHGFGVKLRYSF